MFSLIKNQMNRWGRSLASVGALLMMCPASALSASPVDDCASLTSSFRGMSWEDSIETTLLKTVKERIDDLYSNSVRMRGYPLPGVCWDLGPLEKGAKIVAAGAEARFGLDKSDWNLDYFSLEFSNPDLSAIRLCIATPRKEVDISIGGLFGAIADEVSKDSDVKPDGTIAVGRPAIEKYFDKWCASDTSRSAEHGLLVDVIGVYPKNGIALVSYFPPEAPGVSFSGPRRVLMLAALDDLDCWSGSGQFERHIGLQMARAKDNKVFIKGPFAFNKKSRWFDEAVAYTYFDPHALYLADRPDGLDAYVDRELEGRVSTFGFRDNATERETDIVVYDDRPVLVRDSLVMQDAVRGAIHAQIGRVIDGCGYPTMFPTNVKDQRLIQWDLDSGPFGILLTAPDLNSEVVAEDVTEESAASVQGIAWKVLASGRTGVLTSDLAAPRAGNFYWVAIEATSTKLEEVRIWKSPDLVDQSTGAIYGCIDENPLYADDLATKIIRGQMLEQEEVSLSLLFEKAKNRPKGGFAGAKLSFEVPVQFLAIFELPDTPGPFGIQCPGEEFSGKATLLNIPSEVPSTVSKESERARVPLSDETDSGWTGDPREIIQLDAAYGNVVIFRSSPLIRDRVHQLARMAQRRADVERDREKAEKKKEIESLGDLFD